MIGDIKEIKIGDKTLSSPQIYKDESFWGKLVISIDLNKDDTEQRHTCTFDNCNIKQGIHFDIFKPNYEGSVHVIFENCYIDMYEKLLGGIVLGTRKK